MTIKLPDGKIEIKKRLSVNDYFRNDKFVITLTPSSFDDIKSYKLKEHKCSIVLFYAPWCTHCKKLIEVWKQLAETSVFFNVCAFNCEKYKDHCELIREQDSSLINGYPSIIIYKKGLPIKRYEEERTLKNFVRTCIKACDFKIQNGH